MNLNKGHKLGHRTAAFAVTAIVIAAVILLNVFATALFSGQLWFLDLTTGGIKARKNKTAIGMYGVDALTVNMLQSAFDEVNAKRAQSNEEDVKVDIIFCADPDMLVANEYMRYIYYTARRLEKLFPDTISVSATNVWVNPSSVDRYRVNSYSSIYQTNVIVASGSEFRVTDIDTYYTYSESTSDEPWAYNGEKKFVQSIIAVTKAEAPICGITTNHGEGLQDTPEAKEQYQELLKVLENAGYEICFLDLSTQEIPEDCRLLLTFDPQSDFISSFGSNASEVSEIKKLDEFLEASYSYMVFVDADTPELPNLEEFLEEWGIVFDRYADPLDPDTVIGNFQIKSETSLDSAGLSVIGDYEPEAMGGSITKNMREKGGSPKVVFGNAMSISYSSSYDETFQLANAENGTGAFTYGSYFRNNHSRAIFDVFRSGELSVAQVMQNGQLLTDAEGKPLLADTQGDYKLMTISRESRTVGEGQGYTSVNNASYVCAIGSTDFASNDILGSQSYGNTDVLLETLRAIGREVVPVGLELKAMYESEMTETSASTGEVYYTSFGNTVWTVVLTLLPACVCAGLGITLLVRRKFRT